MPVKLTINEHTKEDFLEEGFQLQNTPSVFEIFYTYYVTYSEISCDHELPIEIDLFKFCSVTIFCKN